MRAQRFQLSERTPNNLLRGADFGRQVTPNADPDIHRKGDQLVNSGKFVHCLNKNGHVLRVHTRRAAMPEVEDMPGTRSVIPEDSLDLCPNHLRLRIQNGGIHVSLQRDLVPDSCPCALNPGRPVQTHSVTASVSNGLKPLPAILRKQNNWHSIRFQLLFQSLNDTLHVLQRKFPVG